MSVASVMNALRRLLSSNFSYLPVERFRERWILAPRRPRTRNDAYAGTKS